ncbi:phosphatidylserine decarboxylase family protein [Amnibacterium sp.]|uniref:phosphatidylserine decarboxylase family protein n=1 Tax=Amnibacterium sp. TaxID=1872496 RepID=UPI0026361D95|nr:phosphatidylserine decarboxylase family protein [Amnibacterium sp.]MCU1472006.1 hypothetical protein [Amnibacterium sp.]
MVNEGSSTDVKRRAGWLPPSQDDLEAWLSGHRERTEAHGEDTPLHPVLVEFQQLMDTDPIVRMYVTQMVEQVPTGKQYKERHVKDVPQLLRLINEVLTMTPEFSVGGMVSTPLAGILDWTLATPAGFAAYRDPRINAMLKKILNAWAEYLNSPDSLSALNRSETGWMSPEAERAVGMSDYAHDPDDEHWGFTSWNDFFTRRLAEGSRPVAAPDDDKVIVSACESTPYRISTDVKRRDRFWAKSQPYSLEDMLAHDESVDEFVGGTVYQAFLSALNYHRWHSPVAGTIVRAWVQEGTYYAEAQSEGPDAAEAQESQGYIAHMATRAIILVQADDPVIGLVAFIAIGMVEVSTCLISDHVRPGYHVAKGEELGCFQFGGSSECLIFRPGAVSEFTLAAIPQPGDADASLVLVRSRLAVAG